MAGNASSHAWIISKNRQQSSNGITSHRHPPYLIKDLENRDDEIISACVITTQSPKSSMSNSVSNF